MKTLKFEIITGVNEGYFHENQAKDSVSLVGEVWQKIALQQFNQKGIYISSVISPSKTVYNAEWGCPKGGEDTVTITSTANPAFIKDIEEWKNVAILIARELKEILKQSTLTIEFAEVSDFIYLQE